MICVSDDFQELQPSSHCVWGFLFTLDNFRHVSSAIYTRNEDTVNSAITYRQVQQHLLG